jgi:hypothetical protein
MDRAARLRYYNQVRRRSPLGVVPHGFYLALSRTLRDSQGRPIRGLFTDHTIERGYIIGEYRGPLMSKAESMQQPDRSYMFGVRSTDARGRPTHHIIDAFPIRQSSFLRYANAPNNRTEGNAEFFQDENRIFLMATRHIYPGEEITAWYGPHTKNIVSKDH